MLFHSFLILFFLFFLFPSPSSPSVMKRNKFVRTAAAAHMEHMDGREHGSLHHPNLPKEGIEMSRMTNKTTRDPELAKRLSFNHQPTGQLGKGNNKGNKGGRGRRNFLLVSVQPGPPCPSLPSHVRALVPECGGRPDPSPRHPAAHLGRIGSPQLTRQGSPRSCSGLTCPDGSWALHAQVIWWLLVK